MTIRRPHRALDEEAANGIILLGVSTGVILTAFLKLVQMAEIIKPDT